MVIKYNLKENITLFSSIAHGFFYIFTVEVVNVLNDNHHEKPRFALKNSKSTSLTHVTDSPSDELSNADDPTSITPNQTGIISTPQTFLYKTSN